MYKLTLEVNKTNMTKAIKALDRSNVKATSQVIIENENGEELGAHVYNISYYWSRFMNGYRVKWCK